jgi:putative SOS response-associated peptidase YedK
VGAVRWSYQGEWVPHPVAGLTTTLPVGVVAADGAREVARVRWGFPVGTGRPVGNCRDDLLEESPMWAKLFGQSHGLFVASGIYEMAKHADGTKRSGWFRRAEGNPIVMPGLIAERSVKYGDDPRVKRPCGGIITTEPSPFCAGFHVRQV